MCDLWLTFRRATTTERDSIWGLLHVQIASRPINRTAERYRHKLTAWPIKCHQVSLQFLSSHFCLSLQFFPGKQTKRRETFSVCRLCGHKCMFRSSRWIITSHNWGVVEGEQPQTPRESGSLSLRLLGLFDTVADCDLKKPFWPCGCVALSVACDIYSTAPRFIFCLFNKH